MTITRLGVLGAIALAIAACGGGATATPPDGGTTAPDATPAPTEGAANPDPGLPSFDPSAILQNLEGIDSYKIEMANNDEVGYSATVVTKPELARDIQFGAGDDAQHIVVIGDQAWTETDGTFVEMPPALASSMLMAFDPMLIAGGFAQPGAWGGATDQGSEEHNGVQAKHFHIDDASFAGAIAGMPAGASIDAWIAEDGGYLVGLEILNGEGEGMVINVTDINDPSNVVVRPS